MNASHEITISSPLKQDFIIELLDGKTYEGITYTFKSKQGIKMIFAYTGESHDAAVSNAKSVIKETEIGQVLYFQVI